MVSKSYRNINQTFYEHIYQISIMPSNNHIHVNTGIHRIIWLLIKQLYMYTASQILLINNSTKINPWTFNSKVKKYQFYCTTLKNNGIFKTFKKSTWKVNTLEK